ncbi:MAG: citramalate synthase, partial [Candidatus Omnitrophica bacterium]|nr:citramalate synthase [Candidatus Omnitrophota bacterium]
MKTVEIYDTTLRDGSQGENVSFTLTDKVKIAEKLDAFGVTFIEGGWPGSNPKDTDFFQEMQRKPLKNAELVAFGSTRRKNHPASKDINLKALVASETNWVAIFGKSWDLHVEKVLRTTLEDNLALIEDSVSFLKEKGKKVIFDAEHFFDGYRSHPDYALKTLMAAERGGADRIVLCDTNGGSLPEEIIAGLKAASSYVKTPLGVHAHNDCGLAVANTVAAVKAGACHVHGTINGLGERCGNADLTTVIPILQLKMGYSCVPENSLRQLTSTSRFVYELANMVPMGAQPFV